MGLAAEALFGFLIEHSDVAPRRGEFAGRDKARESGTDDDRVSHSLDRTLDAIPHVVGQRP